MDYPGMLDYGPSEIMVIDGIWYRKVIDGDGVDRIASKGPEDDAWIVLPAAEEAMNEWIGVDERLPTPDTRVLVAFTNGRIEFGSYGPWTDGMGWSQPAKWHWHGDGQWNRDLIVTHWMPLPPQP